jgi:hypothetical protein
MLVGGAATSISLPFDQCVVPEGIDGPVAIFVTCDSQPLAANVVEQAANSIVAGPTMAFIDTQPDLLGQMVRPAAGSSSNSTGAVGSPPPPPSTTTISPTEASAAIASVSTINLNPSPTGTSSSASATPTATDAPTSGAAAAEPVSYAARAPSSFIGLSPDGNVLVNGWSNTSPSS